MRHICLCPRMDFTRQFIPPITRSLDAPRISAVFVELVYLALLFVFDVFHHFGEGFDGHCGRLFRDWESLVVVVVVEEWHEWVVASRNLRDEI